jgi:hypothetical protein
MKAHHHLHELLSFRQGRLIQMIPRARQAPPEPSWRHYFNGNGSHKSSARNKVGKGSENRFRELMRLCTDGRFTWLEGVVNVSKEKDVLGHYDFVLIFNDEHTNSIFNVPVNVKTSFRGAESACKKYPHIPPIVAGPSVSDIDIIQQVRDVYIQFKEAKNLLRPLIFTQPA